MLKIKNWLANTLAVLLCLGSDGVLAGTNPGTIVFSAGEINPVPGLSGPMLVLLGLFLAFLAFKLFKDRNHTAFLVAALGTGAVLSGVGGIKIVKSLEAADMTEPKVIVLNSQMPIVGNPYEADVYENRGSAAVKVIRRELPGGCVASAGSVHDGPLCAVGLSIAPSGRCSIECRYESESVPLN